MIVPCAQTKKMTSSTIPDDLRQLRACMICSLVKTMEQFESSGCDNCDEFLDMAGDPGKIHRCTTTSFEGYLLFIYLFYLYLYLYLFIFIFIYISLVAMMIPPESWVAKWQRIGMIYMQYLILNLLTMNSKIYTWNVCNCSSWNFTSSCSR